VPEIEADSLFPVEISFASDTTYSGFKINQIISVDTQKPMEFTQTESLTTESFIVG